MRAVVFSEWQTFPSLENVDQPEPRAGEVLLKVASAGACHSDIAIYKDFAKDAPGSIPPPFTLGHENAGWVEALGPGVSGIAVGDAFLVYGPIGCGHCKMCSRGQDTYCENAASMPYLGLGLGRDGGMAEYVTVPARNLVALGDADRSRPLRWPTLGSRRITPSRTRCRTLPAAGGSPS